MEPDVSQILIVAHDLDLKHSISNHYAMHDYHVVATENPLEALNLIAQSAVNVVLFQYDALNPTLTALLQDMLEVRADLPLIVITRVESEKTVIDLLRIGVTDVFDLPLDHMDDLDQSVARHMKRSLIIYENLRYQQELEAVHQQVNLSLAELQQDQIAGRLIQQRMMPPEECSVNGLTMRLYMKSSLYLSGDFIDHIRLDENRVLFYLADVSGHGASSAFLTVLLKNITNRLTRECMQSDDKGMISPAAVVSQINRELLDFDIDKHMTMFMGFLDRSSQMLTYCVGGHLPMPLLSQNDTVSYLPGLGSGLPLGLFEEAEYTDLTQRLKADFRLLLSSDGILEILPAKDNDDKEEQLRSLLERNQSRLKYLVEALDIDQLEAVPDDIALLSICGESYA